MSRDIQAKQASSQADDGERSVFLIRFSLTLRPTLTSSPYLCNCYGPDRVLEHSFRALANDDGRNRTRAIDCLPCLTRGTLSGHMAVAHLRQILLTTGELTASQVCVKRAEPTQCTVSGVVAWIVPFEKLTQSYVPSTVLAQVDAFLEEHGLGSGSAQALNTAEAKRHRHVQSGPLDAMPHPTGSVFRTPVQIVQVGWARRVGWTSSTDCTVDDLG